MEYQSGSHKQNGRGVDRRAAGGCERSGDEEGVYRLAHLNRIPGQFGENG